MRLGADLFRIADTCHVYLLRRGREAILVDFGTGAVLDRLAEFGVDRVTDVLITHHHRDQVQGLARAAAAGIRIWVPPVERELIDEVDEHWRTRPLDNDYSTRQDRFSLLYQVPVTGGVDEYRTRRYGGFDVHTLPTPGHTVGSVSYLIEHHGRRLAFVGDLMHGEGRVWSLAATQWAYTGWHGMAGMEGVAATALSAQRLLDHRPEVLLPSHGEIVDDPPAAERRLRRGLDELLGLRREHPTDLDAMLRHPWRQVSPHLLWNPHSHAHTTALLSDAGTALLFDFGYDLSTGLAAGSDRASRRPLLDSLAALRHDFGIDRVEVAVPTHYHDDHVAGFNLLREVHGSEIWVPHTIAPVLARPRDHDLPCLWYDPVPADRTLPTGAPFRWREYEIGVHELPGHTLYAAAYSLTVDGVRTIATGDQQTTEWVPGERAEILNYQYRNRFRIDDFRRSAELYRRLEPELMVSGHWPPYRIAPGYLDMLADKGERLARVHRDLLPTEVDFGAEGFGARITPYRLRLVPGGSAVVRVAARNPYPRPETATVTLWLPPGFTAEPARQDVKIGGTTEVEVGFRLTAPAEPVTRARIAADLIVATTPFGQQAEALVTVG